MATPNIQNLFERFLQIYGGQSASTEPMRSEPRYQSSQPAYSAPADAPGSDDGYAPTGGVLGGWSSPSTAAPWWFRTLSGSGGIPVGLGGPRLGARVGGLPFPQVPLGPGPTPELPNVHIPEWLSPESMGRAWLERQLLPWTLWRRMHGDDKPSGNMEEPGDAGSSEPSPEQPPDGGGALPTGILGLIREAARNQRLNSNDDQRVTSSATDPNRRQLTVVSPPNRPAPPVSSDPASTYFDWWAQAKKARGPQGSWARSNSSFGGSSSDRVGNKGGGGKRGGRNTGDDDDDYCTRRKWEEENECMQRWRDGEYAHPDHYWGCKRRATERWNACNQNGGTPPLGEPKKWSLDPDEELYINPDR